MSNEIRTRRLIVTLPDACGEEADIASRDLEDSLAPDRGGWHGATVTHALDESPLDGTVVTIWPPDTLLSPSPGEVYARVEIWRTLFEPDEARKLAALLLRVADEIEGV